MEKQRPAALTTANRVRSRARQLRTLYTPGGGQFIGVDRARPTASAATMSQKRRRNNESNKATRATSIGVIHSDSDSELHNGMLNSTISDRPSRSTITKPPGRNIYKCPNKRFCPDNLSASMRQNLHRVFVIRRRREARAGVRTTMLVISKVCRAISTEIDVEQDASRGRRLSISIYCRRRTIDVSAASITLTSLLNRRLTYRDN